MDPNRKQWNVDLQSFRRALGQPAAQPPAINLFLSLHARVHCAQISRPAQWSFEDEVWQNATEPILRNIPPRGAHSIAWIIWHIARIEDVTMNMLVAGSSQLLQPGGWLDQLRIDVRHTGNAMDRAAVVELSAAIDLQALRAYRLAVGHRTRRIVQQLRPDELRQKVDPERIEQVRLAGAVPEAAAEILEYWGKRTIAGLLLMPATRHSFLHLNEALRVRQSHL